MICKKCGGIFEHIAYGEYEHIVTHWGEYSEGGSRSGSSYRHKILQPTCPFCGIPLYQGSTHEEYGPDGEYQSSKPKANENG